MLEGLAFWVHTAPAWMPTTNRQRKQCRVRLVFYLLATHSLRQRGAETLCRASGFFSKPQDNHHAAAHHRAKLRPIRTKPPSGSQSNYQNTNGNFKLLKEIISVSHQPSSAAGWKSSRLGLRVSPFGGSQILVEESSADVWDPHTYLDILCEWGVPSGLMFEFWVISSCLEWKEDGEDDERQEGMESSWTWCSSLALYDTRLSRTDPPDLLLTTLNRGMHIFSVCSRGLIASS